VTANPHRRTANGGVRSSHTWHLRPPLDQEFDRSRWWERVPAEQVHPIAALYELVRRHPKIGALRAKFHDRIWYGMELRAPDVGAKRDEVIDAAFQDLGHEPKAIHCLCLVGLKSWPQLDARNQEYWMMSGGRLKGVDCRDEVEQCSSLTQQALSELFIRRLAELKPPKGALQFKVSVTGLDDHSLQSHPALPKSFEKGQKLLAASLKEKPLTPAQMEEAVGRKAIEAYRKATFSSRWPPT